MAALILDFSSIEYNSLELWVVAALCLALVLASAFAQSTRPLRTLVASLALRVIAIAVVGWIVIGPNFEAQDKQDPALETVDFLLFDSDATQHDVEQWQKGLGESVGARAVELHVSEGDVVDGESSDPKHLTIWASEQLLNPKRRPRVFALLGYQQREFLSEFCSRNGIEATLQLRDSTSASASGSIKSAIDSNPPIHPPLILAPPSVMAWENISVEVRNANPSVKLRVDSEDIALMQIGKGSYHALIPGRDPGSYSLELLGDAGELIASRSLIVHEAEQIAVLTNQRNVAATWANLLPRFNVFGLHTTGDSGEPWPIGGARAVILPMNEQHSLDGSLVSALETYVNEGGIVFFTGMSEAQRRLGPPPSELNALLPAQIIEPPPLPKKDPEEEPENPDEKPDEKPEEKTEPVLTELPKISALFLLDHSGSMGFGRRWEDCQTAVNLALKKVEDYDRIGVALFTDEFRFDERGGITNVDKRIRNRVERFLRDNPPGPSKTDIYGAVEKALDHLEQEPSSVKVLVVISDGVEEGKGRIPGDDHLKLRKRALEKGIIIATIRVGAAAGQMNEKTASKVMRSLATDFEYADAVTDANGEKLFPKLVVNYVNLAYRKFDESSTKREDEKSDQNNEPDKPDPETEKPDPEIDSDEIRLGSVELRARSASPLLAGHTQGLLPLGAGYAAIQPANDAHVLLEAGTEVRSDADSEAWSPALVIAGRGQGRAALLAAPMNGLFAGSWLTQKDEASALLDQFIRRGGRSRLAEFTKVSELTLDRQALRLRLSDSANAEELQLRIHRRADSASEPEVETRPLESDSYATSVGPDVNRVEVLAVEGEEVLASVSRRVQERNVPVGEGNRVELEPSSVERSLRVNADDSTASKMENAQRRSPLSSQSVLLLLALVVTMLPLERWVRRS